MVASRCSHECYLSVGVNDRDLFGLVVEAGEERREIVAKDVQHAPHAGIRTMTRFTVGLLVAAVPAVAFARTPANPPVRIRGTVEKFEGQNLTVKDRSGQSMTVKLADNSVVVGIFKGSVADIASVCVMGKNG